MKGCLTRDGMLYKLAMCTEKNWRRQRGFNYLAKVIVGVKFRDDIEVTESNQGAGRVGGVEPCGVIVTHSKDGRDGDEK